MDKTDLVISDINSVPANGISPPMLGPLVFLCNKLSVSGPVLSCWVHKYISLADSFDFPDL